MPRTGQEIKNLIKPLLLPSEHAVVFVIAPIEGDVSNVSVFMEDCSEDEINAIINYLESAKLTSNLYKNININ